MAIEKQACVVYSPHRPSLWWRQRSRKGYENVCLCLSVRGRRECVLLMHLTYVALENRFGSLGGWLILHCALYTGLLVGAQHSTSQHLNVLKLLELSWITDMS